VSIERRKNSDAVLWQSAFPADSDASEHRRQFRELVSAQPLPESKLQVTALALTVARAWPEVLSNAVDPGRVPTKMGGPAAPDDLELGYLTQTWLAVSNDTAATVSGGYWHHRQRREPAAEARDLAFQDQLTERLAALTGTALF
jgi:NAD(P)-dependent dehydrogenase (short-subunit alcohol dehydrogenase family)